jgi:signal peptidase I
MEPTLYPGDYIVVRKNEMPKRFDIAVFSQPFNTKDFFVKRTIGLPGETVKIFDDTLTIDSKIVEQQFNRFNYYTLDSQNLGSQALTDSSFNIANQKRLTVLEAQTKFEADSNVYLLLDLRVKGLYPSRFRQFGWKVGRYGPIKLPKIGDCDSLTINNLAMYRKLLLKFEDITPTFKDNKMFVKDSMISKYKFKKNYYFMMGDNRYESTDCRYFGPIPNDRVVGVAKYVLWSFDSENNTFNFKRIFKKLK